MTFCNTFCINVLLIINKVCSFFDGNARKSVIRPYIYWLFETQNSICQFINNSFRHFNFVFDFVVVCSENSGDVNKGVNEKGPSVKLYLQPYLTDLKQNAT